MDDDLSHCTQTCNPLALRITAARVVVRASAGEVVWRRELVWVVWVVGVPRVGAGVGAAGVLCGRERAALAFLFLLTLFAVLVSAAYIKLFLLYFHVLLLLPCFLLREYASPDIFISLTV
ncbi:hypothetical protein E2C01_035875 [Portunus trituberculatus]|uniref:Uncharacterized protein n=1 Tax=Portunus trituberculatus TaxID=210409 RepID=A0A5B7FAH2_PORTR|nr:hypothetical protein [Portunus trituberculatus]